LRQTAFQGSVNHRIGKLVAEIHVHFREPLRVTALAEAAHMSLSSFHKHFRMLTGMSPLQFQKRIRLQGARRQMLAERAPVAFATSAVGYGSTSQFSREYTRLFGSSPVQDKQQWHSLKWDTDMKAAIMSQPSPASIVLPAVANKA
jgi:AraC-like DNA-binding protein